MGRVQRLLSLSLSLVYRIVVGPRRTGPQWLQDARWDGRHETSDGEGVKHPSIIIIGFVPALFPLPCLAQPLMDDGM
jgi:hypothetical protein